MTELGEVHHLARLNPQSLSQIRLWAFFTAVGAAVGFGLLGWGIGDLIGGLVFGIAVATVRCAFERGDAGVPGVDEVVLEAPAELLLRPPREDGYQQITGALIVLLLFAGVFGLAAAFLDYDLSGVAILGVLVSELARNVWILRAVRRWERKHDRSLLVAWVGDDYETRHYAAPLNPAG